MIVSSVINRPVQVSVLSNTYAATMAALKAIDISEMAGNTQISVAGYYTPGDGGGGTFYYDSGSSSTDDGGTVIAPDVGGGRWKRIYSGEINPRWYGAKGDGVTDDTAPIQASVDATNAVGGGTVLFEKGTYCISSAITLYNRVTIDLGGSAVIEQTTDAVNIIDCTGSGAVTSRFKIINGRLKYTNAQNAVGGSAIILAKSSKMASSWTLDNLSISNAYYGIYVPDGADTFYGRIGLVTVVDPSNYATYFGGGASVHTHITINQLWSQCTPGSEPSGSRGHSFANIQALNAQSILCDNVQGVPASFSTCTGNVGTMQFESCDRASSSGGLASMVQITNSKLNIGLVSLVSNNITLTGATSFAVVSADSSSRVHVEELIDTNTVLSIGSGTYYALNVVDTSSVITNKVAKSSGTSPAIATNETSANKPKNIKMLDGTIRRLDLEGIIIGTKSSIPSTTDYPEYSIVINSAPTTSAPWGWRLISGTWQALQHIVQQSASADINTTGFTGNELTNANKINTILSRLRSAGIIAP